MGEYEYQGDSTGMDNKDLKERPFPEYLLKKELSEANEKMQEIINAIPGGVAIYKVSDIFETIYFSDGGRLYGGGIPGARETGCGGNDLL